MRATADIKLVIACTALLVFSITFPVASIYGRTQATLDPIQIEWNERHTLIREKYIEAMRVMSIACKNQENPQ